jgi:hypothetical protein
MMKKDKDKKHKSHWDQIKQRTMEGKVSARIKKLYNQNDPIKIIIYNNLCPGDILAMSPAIEALHSQYPGRFITDVRSFHPNIYDHNPHITPIKNNDPEAVHLWTTYPLINKTNSRPVHFIEGYIDWFRTQLDIDLVLETNRPTIYLSDEEKKAKSLVEELTGVKKYWIINAGWKNDYTIKRWCFFQDVVDHFKDKIMFAQIGMHKPFHNHSPLKNVVNLIDKTNIRQLMQACFHAQGGVGTITCIQHMFAAYQKPYIVLHGAREPLNWTQYHTQTVLSNIGKYPCAKFQSCWRSRIVPLNDGDKKDKRCCELPMVDHNNLPVAKCMFDIKPEQVIQAIESYYNNGVLTL